MKLELLSRAGLTHDAIGTTNSSVPSVLFVHGSMHGAWCWHNFMGYFYQQNITCKALSLRGHGKSGGGRQLHRWRLSDYVEDVHNIINTFDRPPIIIGHSLGGMVVQKYMEKYGCEKISATVLLSCSAFSLFKTVLRISHITTPSFVKNLFSKVLLLKSTHKLAMIADAQTLKRAFFSEGFSDNEAKQHYQHIQGESLLAILGLIFFKKISPKAITVPIATMVGSEDRVVKPSEVQKSAHYLNAEYFSIAGNAHDLMLDTQWRESAQCITGWIYQLFQEAENEAANK